MWAAMAQKVSERNGAANASSPEEAESSPAFRLDQKPSSAPQLCGVRRILVAGLLAMCVHASPDPITRAFRKCEKIGIS